MTNVNHKMPKGTSDEHYTPKEVFETLQVRFDLDVASPHAGSHVNAEKWFCKCCHDGLLENWIGNVWMNPPFSNPTPWVRRFIDHGQGIALLGITRGKWWDELWAKADGIVPQAYNSKFERPDGLPSRSIVFRTALFAFGEQNALALKNFGVKVR